jgi:hypothetical protein
MGMFSGNSALLVGAYLILELNFTAEKAWEKFSRVALKFMPFGDSGK